MIGAAAPLAIRLWAIASVVIATAALLGAAIPTLDLLNQIAPFWLLFALAGAASAWLILTGRARQFALIAFFAAALAHASLIAPEFLRPIAATDAAGAEAQRIRVVWLNAQSGTAGESVTEYLLSSNADFILLAEFHAEGHMVTPELSAEYPHFATCAEPHWCNVVILSRRAPAATRPLHETSPSELRVVWADFDIDGAPLRLVATHLQRPYPAARQAAQRAELLQILASAPADRTLLAGDLNAAPWSFALHRFDEASGLTRHDRAMATWPATPWTRLRLPAPEAFMPLDHVYSGDHWRLASIRRGPRTGADHYPIEAEFIWRAE